MKYYRVVLFLLAAALLCCSCAATKAPSSGNVLKTPSSKIKVAVSIVPLADFVRQVGGDRVEVELLIPPGSSPHTFEPKPSQLRTLAEARLLVVVGLGLEFWKDKFVEASGNKALRVIELSRTIEVIDNESHDDHHGHGETGNPHIWLSPRNACCHVKAIRDALIAVDPEGEAFYRERSGRYLGTLEELDGEIREKTGKFSRKRFISHHAAWIYFARDYGLDQAAAIELSPGREPSPREVRDIVEEVKRIKASAIFAEPQFSPKAAEVIGKECGVAVLLLDPIGTRENLDYVPLMKRNVEQMEKAMK
ncbi:MAG: metal ABC transporter substrate-binding protein [Candidatus Eremiobacteraeota bacterium]|nr:metal ABC transporter substrate-binding protein [Candidatus Eremiobacteraeota bacterium]